MTVRTLSLMLVSVGALALVAWAPTFTTLLAARVLQGLGGALFEHCIYDDNGQMINATMADYLTPMAGDMPDIDVAHVQTPTSSSELGAKGVGESGVGGAPSAFDVVGRLHRNAQQVGVKGLSQVEIRRDMP